MSIKVFRYCVQGLMVASLISSALGQGVSITDPGLNAAIREALQKTSGPLTEPDLLSLTFLSAGGRNISSVAGLEAARNLSILDLDSNSITNFTIANALTNLTILDLFGNHLTSFVLSNALPKLRILDVAFNALAQCSIPAGLTNLDTLFLEGNVLTNFLLPSGLAGLTQLDLSGNQLTNLLLPSSLSQLVQIYLGQNRLTSLTLPQELTNLTTLILEGNPFTRLILSELMAANHLTATVDSLRSQGVSVFTYPLSIQLTQARQSIGAFEFAIIGPPGSYAVIGSADFAAWTELGVITNYLGRIEFADPSAHVSQRKFYRALLKR